MKKIIQALSIMLLTTMAHVTNAQCLPSDTIANMNFTGVGQASLCGIVPCESLNFLDGDTATFYTTLDCRKIISLRDSVDGIDLGNVTVCEHINCSTQYIAGSGQPMLNRWFTITPTNNGKANVSLYFLQGDIDDYNTAAFPLWPMLDPNTNLSIWQFDTTLVLGAPVSSVTNIPNSSITATYDAMLTVWTISFPVDSFSTFCFSTPVTANPTLVSNVKTDSFVKLSPNPANDKLNVEIVAERDYMTSIQITDITGRNVKTVSMMLKKGPNNNTIDISTLQAGSYLLSGTNGVELKFSKVIIKE